MQTDDDSPLGRLVGIGAAVVFAGYLLSPILPRLEQSTVMSAAYLGALALIWFYKPFAAGKTFGWISIAVGGVYAAITAISLYLDAERLAQDDAANTNRCLAIQHDMLSARPRRADGPDLFQALGCRARGEGSVYAFPPTPQSAHKVHAVAATVDRAGKR